MKRIRMVRSYVLAAFFACLAFLMLIPPLEGFGTVHSRVATGPWFERRESTIRQKGMLLRVMQVEDGVSNEEEATIADDAQQQSHRRIFKRRLKRAGKFYRLPKVAYKIYSDYFQRLWTETDTDARRRIANDKVKAAIRDMQHVVKSDEYNHFSDGCDQAREVMLQACDNMLSVLPPDASPEVNATVQASQVAPASATPPAGAKGLKKKRRSVLFGAVMGAAVALWVFSGNYVFTGLFTLMTILGQLEYYRMVISTGVYPARRISVIGASSMFLTALFAPDLHQICLPMFGLWAMIWFLTMRRQVSSIAEIATTFTGMFYLGYVPSFWVRIRLLGPQSNPSRIAPLAAPVLEFINSRLGSRLPVPDGLFYLPITGGAKFIFWTWLCLAFNDVGAYFVGRKYGKTKLGQLSPAAGATSPNKSVEGVLGGCAVSAGLGILGAWVLKWPYFVLTGALHGILLGLLGLIGDLTASMLKRDAGLKDFGDLIPEHGGIMDRVDGFIWTAPYSWLVCAYAIPWLRRVVGA